MRVVAILALPALVACIPADSPSAQHQEGEDTCGSAPLQILVGMPYDARDFEGPDRPLRVLPPGSMMTMDHRPDRLNVDLDAEKTILRIWCG